MSLVEQYGDEELQLICDYLEKTSTYLSASWPT